MPVGRPGRAAARAGALLVAFALALAGCTNGAGERAAPETPVPATDGGGGGAAAADAGTFADIPDIVERVRPSVVAVVTDRGEGSGVVWNGDGVIITNSHVIQQARRITIAFADGRRASARVLFDEPPVDLAVLRTTRDGLPPADFARELPELGELAIAIGNPLGFEHSVTAGIISGLGRAIPGSARQTPALVDLIQTDAPISPGNSGGALVNGQGQVVGINVAFIPPQAGAVALGFAIPAPTVTDTVEELLREGDVEHAFLGVQTVVVTEEVARRLDLQVERGLAVLTVVPGSPAADAGIREGDVLVRLGDTQLRTVEDLLGALRRQDPGDRVTVTLVRDGERRDVAVELGERPE